MKPFDIRNRKLIFLAALGGVYLPSLERIIPYRAVHRFLKGYGAILIGSMLFCVLMATRHTVFLAKNLIVRIMAANNVFNDLLCSGRALYFYINRERAQALYDLWDEYFTTDNHGEERQKLLNDVRRPKRKYIIASAAMIQFMLVSWSSSQLTVEDHKFTVPIGLPFTDSIPEYQFWSIFIFITFSLFGPMLLSVDALIMEPLTLISGELVRLRISLAAILNTVQVTTDGEVLLCKNGIKRPFLNKREMNNEFFTIRRSIHKWIAEHQKLLIFHQAMVKVNYWPLALQLLSTTTTICLISFIVATKLLNFLDTFIGVLFFIPNYVLFYITSTYGDLIEELGANVFDSAFASSWSVYPTKIQKDLHVIAMRTNFPLRINIGGLFPLGSKTYFQIVNTAYSFYSFLRFLTSKHEFT